MVNILDFVHDYRLFRQFRVSELLFTEYKCLEQASVFKVWSHHNYFVYVLSGKKKWQTLQQSYMVHAGEAIFVRKGANIIHKFFDVDFCALIVFVPDHFITNIMQQHASPLLHDMPYQSPDTVIPLQMDEVLQTYFQSLFAYFVKDNDPPASLLEVKFRELILNLASSPKNMLLCRHFRSLCHENNTSMREIMEHNFAYNLSLPDFARLCGRSLTAFKKDFKATYHTSPGKWLLQKRLAYSRQLLETTDKNINELAFMCGFENTSHFIRVFKQTYGSPPLQYKKSMLQAHSLL